MRKAGGNLLDGWISLATINFPLNEGVVEQAFNNA